jgi:hypothetical protein
MIKRLRHFHFNFCVKVNDIRHSVPRTTSATTNAYFSPPQDHVATQSPAEALCRRQPAAVLGRGVHHRELSAADVTRNQ